MWWVGTVTNIPTAATINYKIGIWNSANNEEKFADYNAALNYPAHLDPAACLPGALHPAGSGRQRPSGWQLRHPAGE